MSNIRKETKYIVIHSSDTNPTQNFDVKDIDIKHRKEGLFSCAFHKVITREGEVQDGRDIQIAGAHVDSNVKLSNKNSIGIAICGSGIGISIALNRMLGIRAALCSNEEIAKLSRNHNDANVLVLAGRFMNLKKSTSIIDIILKESFEGGRHERRVNKLG